jgi:hypothetical protein
MTKPNKVFHLRLVNGDEILCRVYRQTKNVILVKDPLVVDEVKDNETGRSSIFLSKYTLSVENNLSLKPEHVVTITPVAAEIEDYYKNSVEYSKNYIEPNKIAEIQKVSAMLSSINKPSEVLVLKTSNSSTFLHPQSNSVN